MKRGLFVVARFARLLSPQEVLVDLQNNAYTAPSLSFSKMLLQNSAADVWFAVCTRVTVCFLRQEGARPGYRLTSNMTYSFQALKTVSLGSVGGWNSETGSIGKS